MENKIVTEGKRPSWATSEKINEMSREGKTYEEIGKELGITRQRVGQIIKASREVLNAKQNT
jgi:hypothetical protein